LIKKKQVLSEQLDYYFIRHLFGNLLSKEMDDEEQRIFRQSTLWVFLKGLLKEFAPAKDNFYHQIL
jgi:hypothetical protein